MCRYHFRVEFSEEHWPHIVGTWPIARPKGEVYIYLLPLNCCSHPWHIGGLPLHRGKLVSARVSREERGVLSAGDSWDIVALRHVIRPVCTHTPCGAWAPALAGSRDVRCPPLVTEKQRHELGGSFWWRAAICGNASSHFGSMGRVYSDSWCSDILQS